MRWPGFIGGAWHGSVRTETCPYCRCRQSLARQPLPFSARCKNCGGTFQVTESGVLATKSGNR